MSSSNNDNADISDVVVGGGVVNIDLDAAAVITVTMTDAQLADATGLSAQADDTIIVTVAAATETATATDAIDVFTLAAAPTTALAIADMATGDQLDVSAFAAATTSVADASAVTEYFFNDSAGTLTYFDGTATAEITLTGVTGVTVDAGVFTVA